MTSPSRHRVPSDSDWDEFVAEHPAAHFLQLSGWGRLKSSFGWQSRRVALTNRAGGIKAGAQCLGTRRAGVSFGYVPHGPLVDWTDRELLQEMTDRLLRTAQVHGWQFILAEPQLEDLPAHRTLLRSLGFVPSRLSIQPRSTIRMALNAEDEELLASMKSKWRYNIRKAKRAGVRVHKGNISDVDEFQRLLEETGDRQSFGAHSLAYHRTAFSEMGERHLQLLLAEVEGETVAALALALAGSGSWYLWGASSGRRRETMPNFALQHAAMLEAKRQGAGFYDFWGIPEPLGELARLMRWRDANGQWPSALPVALDRLPKRDLWTVYRMKQGFGGQTLQWIGAWDLPVKPVHYQIYTVAAAARSQILSLRTARAPSESALASPSDGHRLGNLEANWKEVSERRAWNALAGAGETCHFTQSWEWGEARKPDEGHILRFAAAGPDGACSGTAQVLLQPRRLTKTAGSAVIPGGPSLNWNSPEEADALLSALHERLRGGTADLLRVDVQVRRDRASGLDVISRLEQEGWIPSSRPLTPAERTVMSLEESASGDLRSAPSGSIEEGSVGVSGAVSADIVSSSEFRSLTRGAAQGGPSPARNVAIRFGSLIEAAANGAGKDEEASPRAAFLMAKGQEGPDQGDALVVAWAARAWIVSVFSGPSPTVSAAHALLQAAAEWSKAQECRSLDVTELVRARVPLPFIDQTASEFLCETVPMAGTWVRLLRPAPGKAAPHLLRWLDNAGAQSGSRNATLLV